MRLRILLGALALAGLGLAFSSATAVADGFASPADRRLAEANGWIYDDFAAGLNTARQTGKPMMVVLRCPP